MVKINTNTYRDDCFSTADNFGLSDPYSMHVSRDKNVDVSRCTLTYV